MATPPITHHIRRTTHHPPRETQRGITLVEMLISMAVTLVMMAAVVNLFANIGSGVRNRRASMELGSQLRTARARLFKDLAGATSAARPKLPSDDHDDGYLEIIEGQYSDKNPSQLVQPDNIDTDFGLRHATSLVPRDNSGRLVQWFDDNGDGIVDNGTERNSVRSTGSALGDYDDILALTVRSESEPFTGRMPVWDNTLNQWRFEIIESDLAEVIWYAVENPADGSLGEPGMRTVYRRVLLIAPWVEELPEYSGGPSVTTKIELDRVYFQLSDISFRRDGSIRVPNTLSDLTERENRFAHDRTRFPYAMELKAIRNDPNTTRNNFPEYFPPVLGVEERPVFHPFGLPFEWDETESGEFNPATEIPGTPPGEDFNNGNPTIGSDRRGEDVMLNDVLAFDLRVFDPGAPLMTLNGGSVLEPSDAAWNPSAVGATRVGFGAYVDLGWDPSFYIQSENEGPPPRYVYNYAFPTTSEPIPLFKEPHTPGWHSRNPRKPDFPNESNYTYGFPATYDTWPYHYETDGIDQETSDWDSNVPDNRFPNLADDDGAGADQGTNGLDNIVPYDLDNDPSTPPVVPVKSGQPYPLYGADDAMERETQPPYDHALRAMQAKIRVYDRESRQIREATVTRNFVPQ
ncbi:MAG: prepilin-type N-terminal cleavage/methylation domain-containing protein [Planctomycetota bacterium]